jgi:hypothetical protein
MVDLACRLRGVDLRHHGFRDRTDYGRAASPDLLKGVTAVCVPTRAAVVGALALFQFPHEKWPRHVGIVADGGNLIHCNATRGQVVEHGLRAQWARWLHSVWLLPGVRYG